MIFGDGIAVISNFLKVTFDVLFQSGKSEEVKSVYGVVVDVFQNESMLMFELGSIFLNSLFKNFVGIKNILI